MSGCANREYRAQVNEMTKPKPEQAKRLSDVQEHDDPCRPTLSQAVPLACLQRRV